MILWLPAVLAVEDIFSSIGRSGPTPKEYHEGNPTCGRPRFYHKWNLFFELPGDRKRRNSSETPKKRKPKKSESPSNQTESPTPIRTYGQLGATWLKESEQEFRRAERIKKSKRGNPYQRRNYETNWR